VPPVAFPPSGFPSSPPSVEITPTPADGDNCPDISVVIDCHGIHITNPTDLEPAPMALFAVGSGSPGYSKWYKSVFQAGAWQARKPYFDASKATGRSHSGGLYSLSGGSVGGSNNLGVSGLYGDNQLGIAFPGSGLPDITTPASINPDVRLANDPPFQFGSSGPWWADGHWWQVVKIFTTHFVYMNIIYSTAVDANGNPTTWSAPITPPFDSAGAFRWNGGTTINAYFIDTAAGPDSNGNFGTGLYLCDFDMLTKTWGASFGHLTGISKSIGFQVETWNGIVKLGSGDTVAFYARFVTSNTSSQCFLRVYSGGVWGAEVAWSDVVANKFRFPGFVVPDPDNATVHAFHRKFDGSQPTATRDTPVWSKVVGGAVVDTHDFAAGASADLLSAGFISGDRIFIARVNTANKSQMGLVGTPVATPVWTELPINIEPTLDVGPVVLLPGLAPKLIADIGPNGVQADDLTNSTGDHALWTDAADKKEVGGEVVLVAGSAVIATGLSAIGSVELTIKTSTGEDLDYAVAGGSLTITSSNGASTSTVSWKAFGDI
jgi:hypothetical protein